MAKAPDQPLHWRFAAASAFRALEVQIRDFDFIRDAGHATYVGVTPKYYLSVIDGFLAEGESSVPGGNRRALEELRKLLVDHYVDAFECGGHRAIDLWDESNYEYGSVPLERMHSMARELSPFDSTKREWFIEGFCQSWTKIELESLRSS